MMGTVIVDVRKWQNQFNFRTGAKIEVDNAETRLVSGILARHPYPGDMEGAADRWVTDTALDLFDAYKPGLVFLSYARQYFAQRFTLHNEEQLRKMFAEVFKEALRFVRETGCLPIFVGTGDMTELAGEIDLSMLDALVSAGGGSGRFTGLCGPSAKDLDYVASLPGVERLIDRDEWIRLFSGAQHDRERIPDYLLVTREGWSVRSAGTSPRKSARVQGRNPFIPVSTPLGKAASLTDIRRLIEQNMERTPVALIVVEGIGERHFPLPFNRCINGIDWYCYEPSEGQYLTLTTGTHQVFAFPPGHRFSDEAIEHAEYPFSGHFTEIPQHTLGADFKGRSIAVGNRSMFTHMVFGADISIECFARNLYNQGCIAVLKENAAPSL
jgi:hypothetical protein